MLSSIGICSAWSQLRKRSANSKRETGAESTLIGKTDAGAPVTVDRFQYQMDTATFGEIGGGKTYGISQNIKEIVEESEHHILIDSDNLS